MNHHHTNFLSFLFVVYPAVILNLSGKNPTELKNILIYKKKQRGSVTKIANKLGSPGSGPHEWLVLTPKDKLPKPERIAFPKPPKAPDGSLVYERVPNKCIDFSVKEPDVTILPNTTITTIGSTAISTQVTNLSTSSSSSGSSSIRKRPHEDINGSENGELYACFFFLFYSVLFQQCNHLLGHQQNDQTKILCLHIAPVLNNLQPWWQQLDSPSQDITWVRQLFVREVLPLFCVDFSVKWKT